MICRIVALSAALTAAAFAQDLPQNQEPSPKLTPAQVIKIQLAAFQKNDTPTVDSGIRKAFAFASPGNRAATGPIEKFVLLVKNPLYRPLLNHRSAEFGPIQISGDRAEQRVRLIAASGGPAVFMFALGKQKEEPYKDCWMVEGVARIPEQSSNEIRAEALKFPPCSSDGAGNSHAVRTPHSGLSLRAEVDDPL
ncbi:MAG: DUF4864 domain-containing protein [Acidobacteriota bacterium]|nr:DUF4864 domain-containing protein [Acidobacteriota bacterium]